MPTTSRVIIVGCGHMGLAIARGLLRAPDRSTDVVAVERDASRRELLRGVAGLTVSDSLTLSTGDVVVVAVPPQDFAELAARSSALFDRSTPTISVMAGITAANVSAALGTTEVVRAIPNTPSEVFGGMTVYYALPSTSVEVVAASKAILDMVGRSLCVEREELVDDATALCGGGPAFVSYIVDAFCQFAQSRGFSASQSKDMATQVLAGSAELIALSPKPPMQLCREVMTAGGTTERGIAVFDSANLRMTVRDALHASACRSRELAGLHDGSGRGAR
ncbi:MAG: pyrroline-5-carboxylate reductase family protein [Dermatophilaceae bacterium]